MSILLCPDSTDREKLLGVPQSDDEIKSADSYR
jgi:hypothetical protein